MSLPLLWSIPSMWHIVSRNSMQVIIRADEIHDLEEGGLHVTGKGWNIDEPPGSVHSEFTDLPIHHTISSKRCHYNPHTLDNTTDFRSIGHKHSDTVLKPWHPLLTHSVILPSSPCITITISHHGKAPLIDNHPKTGFLHHSEASGWCAYQSFNEMTWLTWVPLPATIITATATIDHVY